MSNDTKPFHECFTLVGPSCWLWTDEADQLGRPVWRDGTRRVFAQEWAYETFVGPIPKDVDFHHHTCPTFWCVNPAHVRV